MKRDWPHLLVFGLIMLAAILCGGCFFPEYRQAKAKADIAEVYAYCIKVRMHDARIVCDEARVAYWRGQ